MLTDLQMLRRYVCHGDAHAFRELVQAHGAMVHATALRVTRDANMAEEVAQETFLELARKSGSITQSVGAWLHRVAWLQACHAVRRERTRRQAEEAMAETWHTDREGTWAELEPHVDQALNELPNDLREVLVLYFLEGRTQAEIAQHLDRNQATVSRAIDRGITAMREALKARGITCGIGLAALFSSHSAQAMPAALQASLGKLSLSGVGLPAAATSSSSTVLTTTLITMTTTTKMLIGSTVIAAGSYFLLRTPAPPAPAPVVEVAKPKPSPKQTMPKFSDEEMFEQFFGKDTDKLTAARRAVEEHMVQHPGKTLRELALDPALSGRMATLMATMSANPDEFKGLAEAAQFAMQMKGLKPGPQSGVNLNLNDIVNTESQAARYLGAVLTDDAYALSDLFSDIVNEAAGELALDPGTPKTTSGVSVREGPLPPNTKLIQKEPED